MNELEQDRVEAESGPAPSAPSVDVSQTARGEAPVPDEVAGTPSEPPIEHPPIWDDPNEPDLDFERSQEPEHSEDPWAFLQDAGQELHEPFDGSPKLGLAPAARASDRALEQALVASIFRANIADLLVGVERALRALPRTKPRARLLELVSRARASGASEPRLLDALLRARAVGRLPEDCGLLAALLTRRLGLPTVRAAPRASAASQRLAVLRKVRALTRRVGATRGDEGLRELARASTRLGARALERGHSLDELATLLRQRFEGPESTSPRPTFETESSGSRRTRRFRLPGRVEIVIYEE
jgi:hypothetical protein